MKIRLLTVFIFITILLAACMPVGPDVTQEQIIAAYEDAGYRVCSKVYDKPIEYGEVAYIRADHPNGDYIYFSVFATPEQAEAYKQELYHPTAMGLFLSIFAGEIYIPKWEVYGCYVVQYEQSVFIEPFEKLLNER